MSSQYSQHMMWMSDARSRPRTSGIVTASTLLVMISVAGCGAEDTAQAPSADASATDEAAATGFPLEIENCGRVLTFDAPPERVVTAYHPSFELMAELGQGDRLIGRTPYDEEGADGAGVLPQHRELYDAVPEISDSVSLPATEETLTLGADFVLAEGYYNFDASNGNATIEELATAGAEVYITGGWCSADEQLDFKVDTLLQDIRNLGAIFGEPAEGEAMAQELQGILDDVAAAVAEEEPKTVLLIDASPDGIYAMGQGMGAQLAELAGLDNPFAESGDTYGEYSAEEVAASQADGFGVISYLPTTFDERVAVIADAAANTPGVQNEVYVEVPASGTHPGYRAFLTVEDLARAFYPDAFTE